ncbi:MAG TPA: 3D domain-containing protein [Pyrinomonadaceae bacterium]|nr:3D domain-containing protein [Pyrinomonadaceae bacterium]
MSKPLLGGSAAAVAFLSASLLFYSQPSVAETLVGSQEIQQKGKGVATEAKTPGAEMSTTTEAQGETGDAIKETENTGAAGHIALPSAFEKSEMGAGAETSAQALTFTATAYSLRGHTANGGSVSRGIIAADRRVLPIGTHVRLEAGSYSGEYVVADTGGAVRGRRIDIWVPNTGEAMRFGRRLIKLIVLTRQRSRTTSTQGH